MSSVSTEFTQIPKSKPNRALTNLQFQPINPKPFLKTLLNKKVLVRLKWNKLEYKGTLLAIDNYMNLQLDDTLEIVKEGLLTREEKIGEIFIRCNNVLFIREAKAEEGTGGETKEEKMEE